METRTALEAYAEQENFDKTFFTEIQATLQRFTP